MWSPPSRRYTYGKPVIGSVKADFCRHAIFFYYWFRGEKPQDICQTYQLTVCSGSPDPVSASVR